jgi:alginate O-acetyltransferase complex protein AlgI
MFPQLVAGPIVRYVDVDEQLRNLDRPLDWAQFGSGLWFFAAGMAQKVLLADPIAARIDPLLVEPQTLQLSAAWFALVGYALQLYFDFAGYSNMAVGLGRMLGFEFCQNFDSPYQADSIQAFWRRWHMSLSQLMRDYLFIPLGGSRGGTWLTLRNLLVVMLLGGLWHGAGWTFVLWGAYHGLLLATNVLWRAHAGWRMPSAAARALTLIAVLGGWVLFRATSTSDALALYAALAGWRGCETQPLEAIGGMTSLVLLTMLTGIALAAPNLWKIRFRLNALSGVVVAALLLICLLRFDTASPFLYFQF